MKFLATLLVFGGYTLVYAAVAKHGRFYADPWMGVFRDAYGVDSQTGYTGGGNVATPSPGTRYASGPTVNGRGSRPRTSPLPPGVNAA